MSAIVYPILSLGGVLFLAWLAQWLLSYPPKRVKPEVGRGGVSTPHDWDELAVDILRASGYTRRAAHKALAERSTQEILGRAMARVRAGRPGKPG